MIMRKKLFVLLADDDKDDRFFFNKALSEITVPTNFIAVEDGEKLMTWLSRNSGNLPDVLFLDINMPRKNGAECLMEIKTHAKLKKVPVIMYSTSLHEDVADVLYNKGASYYIQKTDFTELPRLLEKALKLISEKGHSQPPRNEFVLKSMKLDSCN
jgi:CheY-like chemotaxis protein